MQELCKEALEKAYSSSKTNFRTMAMLGQGNGFTLEATPYCSYASKDGVHVLFAGEVAFWPGIDVVSAAHNGQ